jgi:hypothetical protein
MTKLTEIANNSLPGKWREVVKNDARTSATLPQDIKNLRRAQGITPARPSQSRVLKQNPSVAPGSGCFAQIGECATPSFFGPVNRHKLEGKSALSSCLAQFFAVIHHAVDGLVPPSKQQNDFLNAHFSTR